MRRVYIDPAEYKRRSRASYTAQKPKPLHHGRRREQLTPPPTEFQVAKRARLCKKGTRKELQPSIPQSQQADSLLLRKLPAEIRLQIWENVLGGQTVHILRKTKKLGHRICPGEEFCCHCGADGVRPLKDGEEHPSEPYNADVQLAERSLIPVLLTCRQM